MQWEKGSPFYKRCWENWTATCTIMKLDPLLTSHTTINSKWIQDLNVKHEAIKILEESTGRNFSDVRCSNIFLNIFSETREIEAKINYWDCIKVKSSWTAKETTNKTKQQPTE